MQNHDTISTTPIGNLNVCNFQTMDAMLNYLFTDNGIKAEFIAAINAEKVIASLTKPVVYDALQLASILYADGISVVKTLQKKGAKVSRIAGCELWEKIMQRAGQKGLKVFLLGASEQVSADTAKKLAEKYDVTQLERCNGFYTDFDALCQQIEEFAPDILTVAMGSPKQELVIAKLRAKFPDIFYMGVGGSYDVFVGHVKRAPKLFIRFHLEWLYRLIKQPTRIHRYSALFKYFWLHTTGKL